LTLSPAKCTASLLIPAREPPLPAASACRPGLLSGACGAAEAAVGELEAGEVLATRLRADRCRRRAAAASDQWEVGSCCPPRTSHSNSGSPERAAARPLAVGMAASRPGVVPLRAAAAAVHALQGRHVDACRLLSCTDERAGQCSLSTTLLGRQGSFEASRQHCNVPHAY
jgi:hypothetical protein